MKITGSGPMAGNRKRCQGSPWTVAPAEEERKKEEDNVDIRSSRSNHLNFL
jgi:hypothetical protein